MAAMNGWVEVESQGDSVLRRPSDERLRIIWPDDFKVEANLWKVSPIRAIRTVGTPLWNMAFGGPDHRRPEGSVSAAALLLSRWRRSLLAAGTNGYRTVGTSVEVHRPWPAAGFSRSVPAPSVCVNCSRPSPSPPGTDRGAWFRALRRRACLDFTQAAACQCHCSVARRAFVAAFSASFEGSSPVT